MRSFIFFVLLFGFMTFRIDARADEKLDVLKDNMSLAQRLEDIASAVLTQNPEACGQNKAPYLGAEFMTLEGVGESYRPLVAEHYGVTELPTITIIGKSSPASQGLKIGDVITAVNKKPLASGNAGQYTLEDEIKTGKALNLSIKRAGTDQKIDLIPAQLCAKKIRLEATDEKTITSNNGKIMVSKGALRTMDDQQIASEILKNLKG